jgi:hypothetical protein
MFNIIKRKKPLEVRFFTATDGLVELLAPKPLSQVVPEWWRNTPAYLDEPPGGTSNDPRMRFRPKKMNKTAKHCWSIQKTLEMGITFPLWCDMFVTVDHTGKTYPLGPQAHRQGLGEQHPKRQYPGLLTNEWTNFKFNAEWMAYTEEPANFYMTDPFYHKLNREWQTMPGVIEFHHQHNLNVNTILRVPQGTDEKPAAMEYEFKAGTIMNYFVPMVGEDRKVIVKCEQVDEKEWEKLHYGYKLFFSSAAEHRKNNWGGCPFHIGGKK